MSMWGFARNATKSYLTRLNAARAMDVVKRGALAGRAGYSIGTAAGGRMMGARFGASTAAGELYKGLRQWAWTSPRSALTRGIRIGTAAGVVGGAGLAARGIMQDRDEELLRRIENRRTPLGRVMDRITNPI